MAWTLAHNLQARHDAVLAIWPTMTIGEGGDAAHLAEQSDHNPDARSIVHAIDIMTETDTGFDGAAEVILAWLLAWTDDLQYVIHDRRIYTRANRFRPSPYTGPDPHTNHIHVSGKHGSVGQNAKTGTGYDVAAEAMTPPPLEVDMPLTQADADLVVKTLVGDANFTALAWRMLAVSSMSPTVTGGSKAGEANALAAAISKIPLTAVPAGPLLDADVARIATAVVELLDARLAS